ncbi:unnamed protein product, partial [Prorocentrum cordatum]
GGPREPASAVPASLRARAPPAGARPPRGAPAAAGMGIRGLAKFLQDAAPKAVREVKGPEAFTGRVIAIDASMCLYQFLIMIRESHSGAYSNLTNAEGQVTSHIVGFLSRTIRLMEAGIKPVYVFDGKPPDLDLKLGELVARAARREKAGEALEAAKEAGDAEEVLKATKMGVKVTKEQNEQTKQLLRLMGVPVIEAPSEAEATCAALCRAGKVYAAATEDADCLTFGTKLLIRNLLAAEAQKKTIFEINLEVALEQLGVTMDQFIDFCILCGCDYADTIKGIGPTTAMKLVMQHGCLEKVLENLDTSKTPVPPGFRYQAAREFFRECESVDPAGVDLQWREPDLPGMRTGFLIDENSFSEERTLRFFDRLKAAKSKTKQQPLTMFFGAPKPVVRECDKYDPSKKRSAAAPKGGAKAKAKAKAVAGPAASEAAAAAKPEEEQVASAPEDPRRWRSRRRSRRARRRGPGGLRRPRGAP